MVIENSLHDADRKMLSDAGYAAPAINYYLKKKHMSHFKDADQVSEKTGSCGDMMKVCLKFDKENRINDVRYEITGCAGSICAAMAAVELVKGKTLEAALKMNDGDVFKVLENIPEKKRHCIQLAVKTMHKAIKEYKTSKSI